MEIIKNTDAQIKVLRTNASKCRINMDIKCCLMCNQYPSCKLQAKLVLLGKKENEKYIFNNI